MNIGIIIQARMGSTRLPGKVLRPLCDRPMIAYLLDRVSRVTFPCTTVVCTTELPEDDPLARLCEQHGVSVVRGSSKNVAQRIKVAVEQYQFDTFVRISADSPLLDLGLIHRAVELFADQQWQIVTNVFPRSFPKGQSVEVLASCCFLDSYPMMSTSAHFEHVTAFFYEHHDQFKILNFCLDSPMTHISLAVDDESDFARCEQILNRMTRPHWEYDVSQLGLLVSAHQYHMNAR